MTTSEPGDALPHVGGMRLRSRCLLVLLTWGMLLGATATFILPGLDAGIFDANPASFPLALGWAVLMVALLLQVSHRWRPFVIGIIFMAILGMPGFLTMAVLAGYGQFGMASTTATVVEAHSRMTQPPSVTFEFEDGSRERGYSLGATGGKYSDYIVPSVGSRYVVLRDPVGFLPPRIAGTDEGTEDGNAKAIAYCIPAGISVVLLAAVTLSALTRRESFVTRTAREDEAPLQTDLQPPA